MYLDVDVLLFKVKKAMTRLYISLLFLQLMCYLRTGAETSRETTSHGLVNVSETIEELLADYDIRLRPQFGG